MQLTKAVGERSPSSTSTARANTPTFDQHTVVLHS
jgi:hypothetical protein